MTSETPAPAPVTPLPLPIQPGPVTANVAVSNDGGQTFTPVQGVHVAEDGTETPLPPAPAPEPVPAPVPVPAADAADTVTTPAAPAEPVWPHQTIDFYGDTLQVRTPTMRALSTLQWALSAATPINTQNNIVNRYLTTHLSPDSYQRFTFRLLDPDDTDYSNGEPVRELSEILFQLGTKAVADIANQKP